MPEQEAYDTADLCDTPHARWVRHLASGCAEVVCARALCVWFPEEYCGLIDRLWTMYNVQFNDNFFRNAYYYPLFRAVQPASRPHVPSRWAHF